MRDHGLLHFKVAGLWAFCFFASFAMAINGWHVGERAIRSKLMFDSVPSVSSLFMHIDGDLPPEHALFHTTRLPFLPVTILDEQHRPWGSILAAQDGKPGFIQQPKYSTLAINASLWDGDPLFDNARLFSKHGSMLIAGIGIEFPTRRRNKLAGKVVSLQQEGNGLNLQLTVNEALGNCPKYINVRDLVPHPSTSPKVVHKYLSMNPTDRLPDELISFVHAADTVFFGSSYEAPSAEAIKYPSHLGMNQRAGKPGFIRVIPSDGRTIVLPDYSGNRFMTSLGNIEATPVASLTFVSFTTGDILYITGDAKNLVGADAKRIMALQNTLTTVYTTGYVFVRDALPVRQREGTEPQRSPYSPPIKLLVEESHQSQLFDDDIVTALLSRIELHSPTVATLTWESSRDLSLTPGQAIVLDLSGLLGSVQYQHMAPSNPTSVNDDRIRTWTVSSAHSVKGTRSFSITIRRKPGGAATTAFFTIAEKLAQLKPEALADSRPLQLQIGIIGVNGEFVLPTEGPSATNTCEERKLLWIAGGIGFTPFLSMLKGLAMSSSDLRWDIQMLLSTREPEVLVPLVNAAMKEVKNVHLTLHVFSSREGIPNTDDSIVLVRHSGRLEPSFFKQPASDVLDRTIYVCGPDSFEKMATEALHEVGVAPGSIKREGFEY